MPRRPTEMLECPHCGATFKSGRPACPECGSDEATGWLPPDEIEYQSIDIPDYYPPDDGEPALSQALHARQWAWVVLIALGTAAAFLIATLG